MIPISANFKIEVNGKDLRSLGYQQLVKSVMTCFSMDKVSVDARTVKYPNHAQIHMEYPELLKNLSGSAFKNAEDEFINTFPGGAKVRIWMGWQDKLYFKGNFRIDYTPWSSSLKKLITIDCKGGFYKLHSQNFSREFNNMTRTEIFKQICNEYNFDPITGQSVDSPNDRGLKYIDEDKISTTLDHFTEPYTKIQEWADELAYDAYTIEDEYKTKIYFGPETNVDALSPNGDGISFKYGASVRGSYRIHNYNVKPKHYLNEGRCISGSISDKKDSTAVIDKNKPDPMSDINVGEPRNPSSASSSNLSAILNRINNKVIKQTEITFDTIGLPFLKISEWVKMWSIGPWSKRWRIVELTDTINDKGYFTKPKLRTSLYNAHQIKQMQQNTAIGQISKKLNGGLSFGSDNKWHR